MSFSERSEFDVIIIGGGPAGCAVGLYCAAAGLRVVLIEGARFSRNKPGETLHPGVEPIFAQLGVRERVLAAHFHRHHGVWVEWNHGRCFQAYGCDAAGPWLGFQADRARLDSLLLDAVHQAGVSVLQPCCAHGVLMAGRRVVGVETTRGVLRARWIVDAGGGRHWLASQLGLRIERHSPPLVVRFGWRSRDQTSLDGEPLLSIRLDGWDWEAPIGHNRVAWCELRFPSPAKNTQEYTTAGYRPDTAVFSACDVTWRSVSKCAGPGYFILGDAAGVLDPASSHGILRAMMSGIKAGNTIAHICRGFPESAATRHYNAWLADWFKHDVRALTALYRKHPNLPSWRPKTVSVKWKI